MPADWRRSGQREVADCRVFRVRADRSEHPLSGVERDYFVIDSPDWVNVIALTTDREVVLVRQYRHGLEEVTVEIPGGTVDLGEEPVAAGMRELLEETGFGGGEATLMGSCAPNPAIQANRCWLVLAEGVERLGAQNLDPGEDIDVEVKPLDEVLGMIDDGTIGHALVIAAFHRFARRASSR